SSIALLLKTPQMLQDDTSRSSFHASAWSRSKLKSEAYETTTCSRPSFLANDEACSIDSSLYPLTPSSTVRTTSSQPLVSFRLWSTCNRARLSLPPETATPTLSPCWSMPYLETVLL